MTRRLLSRLLASFCLASSLCSIPGVLAGEMPVQEIAVPPALPQTIDLTVPAPDLWTRIRNGFAMPNLDDELVLRHQQYYQSHPEYLRRVVERSRLYLFHVVEMLEKRGMPTELALLPIVESAYNPLAHSPAQASGLWQFIPSTGRAFDLEQNWWGDQRRDIVASTSAALDYLQHVYEMHGDWHLALASYNWGEGAVGRAIAKNAAKNLPTDYANLTLPAETRNYVPKLQALKNIFANPRLIAELDLPILPNQPYFQTLTTETPIDFSLTARFADMDAADFLALNPAHNRPVIPAQSTLVIPVDRLESFQEDLRRYREPLNNWQVYTLRPKEDLATVAARFGIALADLKRVNGLLDNASPAAGHALLVPARDGEGRQEGRQLDETTFLALARQATQPLFMQARTHVVKKGNTLLGIARQYKTTVVELKRLNRLKSNRLSIGARLVISPERRASPAYPVAAQSPALVDAPRLAARTPDADTSSNESANVPANASGDAPSADSVNDFATNPVANLAADSASVDQEPPPATLLAAASSASTATDTVAALPAQAAQATTQAPRAIHTTHTIQAPRAAPHPPARYKVRKGDTLYSIARHHQISIDALMRANRMTSSRLQTGRALLIPR